MIPFFVGYAMLVWWLTCRGRRHMRGVAALGMGIAGLILINWLHLQLGTWSKSWTESGEGFYIPVLQSILWPYTGLVAGVGAYIFILPVRPPTGACQGCGYDLVGLGHPVDACPECGQPSVAAAPRGRRSGMRRADLAVSDLAPD